MRNTTKTINTTAKHKQTRTGKYSVSMPTHTIINNVTLSPLRCLLYSPNPYRRQGPAELGQQHAESPELL